MLENSVPAAHHPITSIRNIKITTIGTCTRSEKLALLCRGRQTQGHCAHRKYDVAEIENIKTIIDLSPIHELDTNQGPSFRKFLVSKDKRVKYKYGFGEELISISKKIQMLIAPHIKLDIPPHYQVSCNVNQHSYLKT